MDKVIAVVLMAAACSASLFSMAPSQDPEAYNICIYSKDPTKYEPKCFNCATAVYTNAMLACTNGTTMPNNITYSSATCLEKNCAINYPKPPTPAPAEQFDSKAFFEGFQRLLNRMTRSISNNDVQDSLEESLPEKHWRIIARFETFASDSDFTELDYNT